MGSRGIALLFYDHGTRRGWGISVTPRPLFTPGKDPVPIVKEAGCSPGPVWRCADNLALSGIRSPDSPTRNQSLNRLSYPAHILHIVYMYLYFINPRTNSNYSFVNNQFGAQSFFMYVYFHSLLVSGSHVPIIRRINCINTRSSICYCVLMTVWCAGLNESHSNVIIFVNNCSAHRLEIWLLIAPT